MRVNDMLSLHNKLQTAAPETRLWAVKVFWTQLSDACNRLSNCRLCRWNWVRSGSNVWGYEGTGSSVSLWRLWRRDVLHSINVVQKQLSSFNNTWGFITYRPSTSLFALVSETRISGETCGLITPPALWFRFYYLTGESEQVCIESIAAIWMV